MSLRYIPQDTIDEAREALRAGATLDRIAGQLRILPTELASLIGLPQMRRIPADTLSDRTNMSQQ